LSWFFGSTAASLHHGPFTCFLMPAARLKNTIPVGIVEIPGILLP
jgi:hypothetical protein